MKNKYIVQMAVNTGQLELTWDNCDTTVDVTCFDNLDDAIEFYHKGCKVGYDNLDDAIADKKSNESELLRIVKTIGMDTMVLSKELI